MESLLLNISYPIQAKKLILGSLLLVAACSGDVQGTPNQLEMTPTPEQELEATALPPTATSTSTMMPTATIEPTATEVQALVVTVSENTNCREGPGIEYVFEAVLAVGEVAEVMARDETGEYWYISGAALPEAGCWIWGEYAQVQGAVESLPVITPAPSPTPQVGFDVYIKQFIDCGYEKQVVFAIKNVGGERIWSGYVEVQDFYSQGTLYKARERHPFAAYVTPACPPDHGNELWPGETRYIHVPYDKNVEGITAVGIITLCTADHQGGTCLTEYSYFDLP
jgi:hypothetical protein